VEIQTSVIQMNPTFATVNCLVGNISENVDLSESKFVQADTRSNFELITSIFSKNVC